MGGAVEKKNRWSKNEISEEWFRDEDEDRKASERKGKQEGRLMKWGWTSPDTAFLFLISLRTEGHIGVFRGQVGIKETKQTK